MPKKATADGQPTDEETAALGRAFLQWCARLEKAGRRGKAARPPTEAEADTTTLVARLERALAEDV